MEYQKAKTIIENNQHLIGETINGGKIDELVIYPTEQQAHDEFVASYIKTKNAENSINPFRNMDVDIYAIIDKGRINAQGLFLHASLDKIATQHQVNL